MQLSQITYNKLGKINFGYLLLLLLLLRERERERSSFEWAYSFVDTTINM